MHNWALFRLLFIFLLACPLLIVPMLLGLFRAYPKPESNAGDELDPCARAPVSGLGTWDASPVVPSESLSPDRAVATTQRRAA